LKKTIGIYYYWFNEYSSK